MTWRPGSKLLRALASGYRAWVQVFALEFQPTAPLTEGAVVTAAVTTSGRTRVDVTLELVQDGRVLLLAERAGQDQKLPPE